MRHLRLALAGIALIAPTARGQAAPTVAQVVARAQQRAAANDSAGGRAILDSTLASDLADMVSRAEVTYWGARLAPSTGEREQQLMALIVEFPFAPRVASALFELGMAELARGDRDQAAMHLTRFLATPSSDSNRTAASLALGRLLFDRGEGPRACAVLLAARAQVPATAVETRNQFDFAVGPCSGVDTSAAPRRVDTTKAAPSVLGEYTVQVAAFDLRAQADRMAAKLRGDSLEARVIGTKKPFRVRVGHFVTRPEAEAEAKRIGVILNMKPIVVVVGAEEMPP
jgi:cell division septation protein DedD